MLKFHVFIDRGSSMPDKKAVVQQYMEKDEAMRKVRRMDEGDEEGSKNG
jgi:hypothetical protein